MENEEQIRGILGAGPVKGKGKVAGRGRSVRAPKVIDTSLPSPLSSPPDPSSVPAQAHPSSQLVRQAQIVALSVCGESVQNISEAMCMSVQEIGKVLSGFAANMTGDGCHIVSQSALSLFSLARSSLLSRMIAYQLEDDNANADKLLDKLIVLHNKVAVVLDRLGMAGTGQGVLRGAAGGMGHPRSKADIKKGSYPHPSILSKNLDLASGEVYDELIEMQERQLAHLKKKKGQLSNKEVGRDRVQPAKKG